MVRKLNCRGNWQGVIGGMAGGKELLWWRKGVLWMLNVLSGQSAFQLYEIATGVETYLAILTSPDEMRTSSRA
jgi:hypothetical protein